MTSHMTTDAQTQAISRPPAPVLAVAEAVIAAEVAAPESAADDAQTESVQQMYEAGLARLHALHDRWAAAVAEIRGAQPSGEPRKAAA